MPSSNDIRQAMLRYLWHRASEESNVIHYFDDCGDEPDDQQRYRYNTEDFAPLPNIRVVVRGLLPEDDPRFVVRRLANDRINNTSCKFYSNNPYLRCAVNPAGQCEGCNDCEE